MSLDRYKIIRSRPKRQRRAVRARIAKADQERTNRSWVEQAAQRAREFLAEVLDGTPEGADP